MKKMSYDRYTYLSFTRNFKIVTALILSCFALPASSQEDSRLYYHTDDMKHYSSELSVINTDHTILVGTVYRASADFDNQVNFVRVDPLSTPDFADHMVNELFYCTDASELEFRSVDVVSDGTDYFITAQLLKNMSSFPTVDIHSVIVVLQVDESGMLIDQWEIENPYPNNGYENLFPLHSIWHNGYLFICGYATQAGGTALPDYPTDKVAFVVQFDPTGPSAICNTWDYAFIGTLGSAALGFSPGSNDYDMAMRMTLVGGNPDIHVTGSCNTATIANAAGNVCGTTPQAGTLNLVIDPSTLSQIVNDPIRGSSDEYGIGIGPDGGGNGYHVIGNYFTPGSVNNTFDPVPTQLWGTRIDNGYKPTMSNSRFLGPALSPGSAWALQVLPSASGTFTIAGMQNGDLGGFTPVPSNSMIVPFLADMTVNWGSGVSFNFWQTYPTSNGTVPSGNTNSYYEISRNSAYVYGMGMANNAWNPTFANYDGVNAKYNMSAPIRYRWTPGPYDFLNYKFFRTDANGDMANCPNYYTPTAPTTSFNQSLQAVIINNCSNGTYTYDNSKFGTAVSLNASQITYISQTSYTTVGKDVCSNGGGNFRSANTNIIDDIKPLQVSVYPNPAQNYIQVDINGSIANGTNAKVELFNIYGQRVAELYNGLAENVNGTQMKLPDVATGIYLVKVYTNDKLQSQHKLNIE